MAMRHEFYVIGASSPLVPFRSRKAAVRELRLVIEALRTENPNAPDGHDFGVYVQHRQF